MKAQIVSSYLLVLILVTDSTVKGQPVTANSQLTATKTSSAHNKDAAEFAHVFIYYPIARTGTAFSIYMNRKYIVKLPNGGRIKCMLSSELPLSVTLVEGNLYREPLTQSRNSRIISIKKGKSYYFKINGTGELEYVFNNQKGEKSFNEAQDFIYPPLAFVETPGSVIPSLDTARN